MNDIEFLVTTVSKTYDEIVSIVKKNIKTGHVLVGNQLCDFECKQKYFDENLKIIIFNLTSRGVSKNRNFLLSQSKAKYVTFLDDDVLISNDVFSNCFFNENYKAIRFNLKSSNSNRPIKSINKEGKMSFNQLRSFGVWGIIFDRSFLINNKIIFDENIGPGSIVNHGEDSLFLKNFFKYGDMYQFVENCFIVEQEESTWQGSNRNLIKELKSHGYVYKQLFGCFSNLFLFFHIFKHKSLYKESGSIFHNYLIAKKGSKACLLMKKNRIDEAAKLLS